MSIEGFLSRLITPAAPPSRGYTGVGGAGMRAGLAMRQQKVRDAEVARHNLKLEEARQAELAEQARRFDKGFEFKEDQAAYERRIKSAKLYEAARQAASAGDAETARYYTSQAEWLERGGDVSDFGGRPQPLPELQPFGLDATGVAPEVGMTGIPSRQAEAAEAIGEEPPPSAAIGEEIIGDAQRMAETEVPELETPFGRFRLGEAREEKIARAQRVADALMHGDESVTSEQIRMMGKDVYDLLGPEKGLEYITSIAEAAKERAAKLQRKRIGASAARDAARSMRVADRSGAALDENLIDVKRGQDIVAGSLKRTGTYEYLNVYEKSEDGIAKFDIVKDMLRQNPRAEVGGILNEITYNIAQSRESGRLTNQDVEMARGIRSLKAQVQDFLTKQQSGQMSEETMRSMESSIRAVHELVSKRLRERYERARRAGGVITGSDGKKGVTIELESTFGGMPWYESERAKMDESSGQIYTGPRGSKQQLEESKRRGLIKDKKDRQGSDVDKELEELGI